MICSNCNQNVDDYTENCPFCGSTLKHSIKSSKVNDNQLISNIKQGKVNYLEKLSLKNENYFVGNEKNAIYTFIDSNQKNLYSLLRLTSAQTKEGKKRIIGSLILFIVSLLVFITLAYHFGVNSLMSKVLQLIFGSYFIIFFYIALLWFPNPFDGVLVDENKDIIGYLKHNIFHSKYNFEYDNKNFLMILYTNKSDQVILFSNLVLNARTKAIVNDKFKKGEVTSVFDKEKLIAKITVSITTDLQKKIVTTSATLLEKNYDLLPFAILALLNAKENNPYKIFFPGNQNKYKNHKNLNINNE